MYAIRSYYVDPFTSEGISELIVSIKEKYKTAGIVVTHDMKSARITADRMIISYNFV